MTNKLVGAIVGGVFLGTVFFSAGAMAQGNAPKTQYKKETRYDFDDDLVEGELMRPDGVLVDSIRKAKHSSLIKIRENFVPEMLKSAEDI